jgi:predicted O-methyltransferase YrrM
MTVKDDLHQLVNELDEETAREALARLQDLRLPRQDLGATEATARVYAYEHAWAEERVRLAGLEAALDPGTRGHLTRLGVGPGTRCLEIGAGRGSVAFWLARQVAPGGRVVATDLETDFLESEASGYRACRYCATT